MNFHSSWTYGDIRPRLENTGYSGKKSAYLTFEYNGTRVSVMVSRGLVRKLNKAFKANQSGSFIS